MAFLATLHMRYEVTLLSRLRRSTSHSEFIPVIDGLRFLAIFPVVLQHLCERAIRVAEENHLATASDYALINLLPTGYLGVELFFVISGLIISYPFISAHFRGQRKPSVRNFYLRRVTRLEPPYFLVMIGCYSFLRITGYIPEGTHTFSDGSVSLETSLAASLVYMHGLLLGGIPMINPPVWSLELEIQFYILAPIVVLAVLRLQRLPAIVLGFLALIAGSIVASHFPENQSIPLHAIPLAKFFHLFLAGILVNLLTLGGLVPQRIPQVIWDVGFIVAIVALFLIDKDEGSILAATAQVPCYLVLFLAAFEGMMFRRFLSLPWIFTIGGMCYTIYLIHLPILQVLTGLAMRTSGCISFMPGLIVSIIVTLPILFALSVAFFLLIEKPCMNPKWPLRFGDRIAGWAVQMGSGVVATRRRSQSPGNSKLF
jgi:peptidoglycan/LPS O-acetylase OafA/YrhL